MVRLAGSDGAFAEGSASLLDTSGSRPGELAAATVNVAGGIDKVAAAASTLTG